MENLNASGQSQKSKRAKKSTSQKQGQQAISRNNMVGAKMPTQQLTTNNNLILGNTGPTNTTQSQLQMKQFLASKKNLVSKESPNKVKTQKYNFMGGAQSHQQLPLNIEQSKLVLGVSGPTLNQQYLEMQVLHDQQMKNNFSSQKYSAPAACATQMMKPYGASKNSQQSNQRTTQLAIQNLIGQQKFLGQINKPKSGKQGLNVAFMNQKQQKPQPAPFSNTQNINNKNSKKMGFQRVNSHGSRKAVLEERKNDSQLNCYMDDDQKNQNIGSGSRNQRLIKAQTTKNNIPTINQEELKQIDTHTKTLYTNISLRELSQSPGKKDGKVVQIQSKNKGQQLEKQRGFNNTSSFTNYQNQSSQALQKPINQQVNFENQVDLKNYLSQLNQNQQPQVIGQDKNGNPILNIKTVQDINIYNNSFIVNSSNIPPNNNSNKSSGKNNIIQNKNLGQQVQGQVQIQNQNNNQITSVGAAKQGLKLRKELNGLTNGLSQVRSVSQGRSLNRNGISTSSTNQITNNITNPSRTRNNNIVGAQTDYNSYGAIPNNQSKLSRGFDQYNQNIRTQNISSLQQNPNQKRMLQPSNINNKFGNLSGLNQIKQPSSSMGRQQIGGHYSNSNTKEISKNGLNKMIKGVISSKTSRVQSRADSRQGNRNINLQKTDNLSLQQMKSNYISNQQIMIGSNTQNMPIGQRAVSQMEQTNHFLNETGGNNSNMSASDLGGNNLHSQSQFVNSQILKNQHYQNKPKVQANNNSYEVRRQSLQGVNGGSQSVNKFRNNIQQISSDHDGAAPSDQVNTVPMANSMNIKNNQYFNNENGKSNESQKNIKEFNDRLKLYHATFEKIQKECQQMNPSLKEEKSKQIQKNIQQLQQKISQTKKQISAQNKNQVLDQIADQYIKLNQETIILKALCMLDQGQNFECINELRQINGIKMYMENQESDSLTSDQLLALNMEPNSGREAESILKQSLMTMSIAQQRMGEHDKSLATITKCINQFHDFKDALLVRGQKYLLKKQNQKSLQDFIKFNQLVTYEKDDLIQQSSGTNEGITLLYFQTCIGKESIGDAYKKMKKYKQAQKNYNDALQELSKLPQQKQKSNSIQERVIHFQQKLKLKIAMCEYYQGSVKKAMPMFKDLIAYYHKFDPTNVNVQYKNIKCNFYFAKSQLAGKQNYQNALTQLSYCTNELIDPELHELYSGNSYFEIFKIFIQQKDIYSCFEYLQRATDNNFSSKRLSLYRDFTEGVVYLMKRKIKKGVQILTDLLEILINSQREIDKNQVATIPDKNKFDRYNLKESTDVLIKSEETPLETLNEKANQIASGKFTKEMYDFLIFNIYVYRSYGYVAIEKYEHALEDLKRAKKINPRGLDKATIYNKWLSRGILKMDTEEYLMASKYFGKASIRFPDNKDAFCLNVISTVRSYSYSMNNIFIDNSQKCDKIIQTKNFLDVAIQCCCKDVKQPSLYFFRGLLNYQMHNFYDALNDFNVSIAEEEEATGQFHLARGRCYACLSILDEAMKDLSIALELDETLHEAYIFRGKCAYLLGDNNLAFHDFQKLIISDQKNPIVHIYAGNLLMTTGAYTDAIKAFDNADTVHQTPLASFQRIRCFCALSDLENAFEQMQLCMHQAPQEQYIIYDFKILLPLLSCVRSFAFVKDDNNEINPEGIQEQQNIIQNCISQISKIITIYENGEHHDLKKENSPMTIQIIPNVGKIKIEKKMVIEKLQPHCEGIPQYTPLSQKERKQLDSIQNFGYYRENIFQLEEMYLYRSIFHFYVGNYQESQIDLAKSQRQHFQANKIAVRDANGTNVGIATDKEEMYGKFSASQLLSPMNSIHSKDSNSQKTDLSEVGLCSLNINEYSLNQMLIHIQLKNWPESLKKVNELLTTSPQNNEHSKSIKQLLLVRAMIHQELGQIDKQNQDMTMYLKNFNQIVKTKLNTVLVEPFDSKGRICNQFEPITLNFQKPKSKSGFQIQMRPSFSMPFIKPPNMIPNINEDVVQSEFNLKQIDAPMPEAPWVRFCKNQDDFQPQKYFYEVSPRWTKPQNLPQLPKIVDNQRFTTQYFQKDFLLYDEKVMQQIDDLSDTDKVSLLSDLDIDEDQLDEAPQLVKEKLGDLNLNLKNISKLNVDVNAKKVNNGIMISKCKKKCKHTKNCSSCYELPIDPASINISNQEQLMQILLQTDHQKNKLRSQLDNNIKNWAEDTVSDEDYGTSDEDDSNSKKSKTSKYTHSRFSSQIDAELDELMPEAMKDIDIDNLQEIEINNDKILQSDKRNLLLKENEMNYIKRDIQFTEDIGSIQNRNDPMIQGSPEPKMKKQTKIEDLHLKFGDSLVMIGSKNLDKVSKKKKKSGIGGLGGTNNLKKNKLAIAFNNLEMGNNSEDGQESD